jgi:ABC-type dipeptide/oligopeptide/nickel transport system permease subunit/predicted ABC-type transport system involved in lysophospholipase L1 biosynthesis ATPase subunit
LSTSAEGTNLPQQEPALEAFALTKSGRAKDQEVRSWRAPAIVVQPGETVALQGDRHEEIELLLGMLAGLTEPSGGVLRVDGQAVEDMRPTQRAALRARKMGFLFREPRLLPDRTVLQNVILPLKYLGTAREKQVGRGRELLDRLELRHLESHKPADLTELERRLVALARALANHPVVILADEPLAGLAPDEAARFAKMLQQLCREEQVALVFGTTAPGSSQLAARTISLPPTTVGSAISTLEEVSSQDLFSELYETEIAPLTRPLGPLLDLFVKPSLYVAAVAVAIVFLTFFGLRVASYGRANRSVDLGHAVSESVGDSADYLGNLLRGDLGTYRHRGRFYYWTEPGDLRIIDEVRRTIDKSLALLLLSMLLGGLFGVLLGLVAALLRHRAFSLFFVVAAIVGVSTPSFFLALLLQILEVGWYKRMGFALLPLGGFGWDSHIVLPALVLAARPIAQVARVAFVSLSQVLDADYIRTARSKGLIMRQILSRHALRNAGVPILAAMGTSLRFSLSSLPIVEVIFQWPGMGLLLLENIRSQEPTMAATLALILGVFFVLVHVALDQFYRLIDPRLREEQVQLGVERSWVDILSNSWAGLRELPARLESSLPWSRPEGPGMPPLPNARPEGELIAEDQARRDAKIKAERRRAWIQSTAGSAPFVVGATILLVLLAVVVLGQNVAPYSPYSTFPNLTIDGELQYAPFAPSQRFSLGTDPQGRDILSLLLYGARRTLTLAFFAVLARLLLGTILGALSGWFSGSLLDRGVMGLTQVIAAFPALLMAMVLIYAFGIRQGLWVFALALCLIGWGEAAQFVRAAVMHIREQDYVEGALATGLGDVQLMARHVLPNLVPSLVVLACLEMGGVLMLLAELGFIGVFIGGGTRTVLASDQLVTYFDVPEWGVMLSNTWRSFRSKPWMTFYPAMAFTLAIIGFNLFGEGLRRLTERLTISMHRVLNRYTVGAAFGLGALLLLAAEGTGSWRLFTSIADGFSAQRAMTHIQYLASDELDGRAVDTPGLEMATQYIADQFAELGLQPAGPQVEGALSYFVPVPVEYGKLASEPLFELYDSAGEPLLPLTYRQDYAEVPDAVNRFDELHAEVVCVGMQRGAEAWPESMNAAVPDLTDKIIMLPTGSTPRALSQVRFRGVLFVVDEEDWITHRELATATSIGWFVRGEETAYLFISPTVADAILSQAGYTLQQVRERQSALQDDDGFLLRTGVDATIAIDAREKAASTVRYVQAFIPGRDVGSRFSDEGLDREMVILLANADGVGRGFDGTLYPGANNNASGVAVMLEAARLLTEADYEPYRTVMFVAWAGDGIRAEPSFWHMLRGRPGFLERYKIIAVLDLRGVGAGGGDALVLYRSTSARLTEVLQQAASRTSVETSTLGIDIHGVYTSLYPQPNRKVPSIALTWDDSYVTANTPADDVDGIDRDKLQAAGRTAALALMYLAHEKEY